MGQGREIFGREAGLIRYRGAAAMRCPLRVRHGSYCSLGLAHPFVSAYFLVGREAAERLLGELELAVDGDLEHAAARADEFVISLTQL